MPKSARPRAGLPIIVLCFCGAVLLLLPGLAFAAALMQPDMLLVAHGSSGAVPAVCLHQGSVGFSRGSYSILHPGTNDSAYQLLAHLDQMGCQEIDCIFVPALAAPMRSLEVYLKRKPVK
ncbi:MAG: hypothetical protein GX946_00625 [Oligosphaeraceae bacterium]|nr:hypothetical protein [Oligosphaeraceae bacterium]